MTELIFSDGGAGALQMAMSGGELTVCGAKITVDGEGNETAESFVPAPYTGPRIEGSTDDIAAIWLMADVGDISALHDWRSRLELLNGIFDIHEMETAGETDREAARARELVSRLERAAEAGAPVRIWWSDAADESCGFCWAMSILEHSRGEVLSVKVPHMWKSASGHPALLGTRGLAPGDFPRLLELEAPVAQEQRRAAAGLWERLVRENSPLRAVINGSLCSVPEDFYDYALRAALPAGEFKVIEAIGRALSEGPPSPGDWWYAFRLRRMLAAGELEQVKQHKRFYFTTLRKKA